jgi:hypothetical protein
MCLSGVYVWQTHWMTLTTKAVVPIILTIIYAVFKRLVESIDKYLNPVFNKSMKGIWNFSVQTKIRKEGVSYAYGIKKQMKIF